MKFSKRKLKALEGSIKKWEKILDGSGVDKAESNCPLCKLYINSDCKSCPVSQETGKIECAGTSYVDWYNHHTSKHGFRDIDLEIKCFECGRLAKKELDFLKSLLPSEGAA